MSINIGNLLTRRAKLHPELTAFVAAGRTLSFSELDAYADRVASALATLSIGRGDRVAVMLRNGAEYCALYYAAAKLGAILCCINWRLAAPEVAYILADSGARALIFDVDFLPVVRSAVEQSPVEHMRVVGDAGQLSGIGRFEALVAEASGVLSAPPVSPELPLAICYTSGTTGRPKGAVLTHAQMCGVASTICHTLDFRQRDVTLIAAPMFHVGGLSFVTLFVHCGATAISMPGWNAEQALDLIRVHKVNHFFAVPTMLELLLAAARERSSDLASVRWILSGGAPMPLHLAREFSELGIPLLESYGCTETAGAAATMDAAHVLSKPGSIGKPFIHTDMRLVDADGNEPATGEIGEVQVRAPHVFEGYWNNKAATDAVFDGEWLMTGDLARRDADGYLYVVDRKKHMIICGGENVYPAEVEQVLGTHPAIAEVAIVGAPDPKWGEAVRAVVVLRPGCALSLGEAREHCQGKIASYKMPTSLTISPEPLRRTVTGKLMKAEIQAIAP
ncbi:class I adenylate-forming enzyme family protein [Variovorax sp. M-6]|uniref:class I adenylate-forming enzyme family protein n=1 Tax=Variovorax sp. M-6 TaxID=3233041 RepID=UPI003F9CD00F